MNKLLRNLYSTPPLSVVCTARTFHSVRIGTDLKELGADV